MFTLIPSNQFKKDLKTLSKRSTQNLLLIKEFLLLLQEAGAVGVDRKYRPHKLSGNYKNNWEAHIKPDMLIIWFEITQNNQIILIRAGSHSDLF